MGSHRVGGLFVFTDTKSRSTYVYLLAELHPKLRLSIWEFELCRVSPNAIKWLAFLLVSSNCMMLSGEVNKKPTNWLGQAKRCATRVEKKSQQTFCVSFVVILRQTVA